MAKDLEQTYFTWLCNQVDTGDRAKTYNELFGQLHTKEFVWVIPNDDNRIYDAIDLRNEFLSQKGFDNSKDLSVNEMPVSVLEVIVALSRRLEFITDQPAPKWAWTLIENLGFKRMADPLIPARQRIIDDVLEALIWRTYRRNGQGGLFPLASPGHDQTKVEIWYQMHEYLTEHQS